MNITQLPHEVLLHVLSYLDLNDLQKVQTISSTFDNIIRTVYVWRNVNFNQYEPTKKLFDFLVSHAAYVRHLIFGEDTRNIRNDTTDSYMWEKLCYFTHLVSLDISRNYCLNDASFLSHMPHLSKLTICCCYNLKPSTLTDHLKSNFLKYLDISLCDQLCEADVLAIVINLPNLTYLDCQRTSPLRAASISCICDRVPTLSCIVFTPDILESRREEWTILIKEHSDVSFGGDIHELISE